MGNKGDNFNWNRREIETKIFTQAAFIQNHAILLFFQTASENL